MSAMSLRPGEEIAREIVNALWGTKDLTGREQPLLISTDNVRKPLLQARTYPFAQHEPEWTCGIWSGTALRAFCFPPS